MRRLILLSLTGLALLFGVSSGALAARATVSDPSGSGTPIFGFGEAVTVGFQSCSDFDWTGQGCVAFTNDIGNDIYRMTFSFAVNASLVGETLTCVTVGDVLTSNDCGEGGIPMTTVGQHVTFSFFGGNPIPAGGPPPAPAFRTDTPSPGGTLYLSLSEINGSPTPEDLPDITAMAVVPEPAELGVFGIGLLLIGLGLGLRRRWQ